MNKYFLPALGLILLTGCSSYPPDTYERLGQFTVASTFNVRNLAYDKAGTSSYQTKGKSCFQVDRETLEFISGPQDDLLQRAMDDAIRNGQAKGIDGDILVNTRINRITEHEESESIFGSDKRFECVSIEGDLVKISSNKKFVNIERESVVAKDSDRE